MDTIELRYKPLSLDDDEFYEFCRQNDQLKIERDSEGTIYVMSNTGGTTGILNAIISYWLMHWHLTNKLGHVFDSSTEYFCEVPRCGVGFRRKLGAVNASRKDQIPACMS